MALSDDGGEPGRARSQCETSADGPRRLLLFDVDGTLLKCGPQIRTIFEGALVEVFGTAGPIERCDFAGKTDHGIVRELLRGAGLAGGTIDELFPVFRDHYLDRLDERLEAGRMRLMPGLPEVLERLAARQDVALGLLTGNFRRGAAIKLSRLGLDGFFTFGAFGDDVASRLDLPPVALDEARTVLGVAIPPEDTLIVGDSALDVACARAHDVGCVAVTTGFASRAELVSAGAEWIVEDLLEAERRYFEAPSPAGRSTPGRV